MKMNQTGGPGKRPTNVARSIAWPDYDANLRLAQKTRRAVFWRENISWICPRWSPS